MTTINNSNHRDNNFIVRWCRYHLQVVNLHASYAATQIMCHHVSPVYTDSNVIHGVRISAGFVCVLANSKVEMWHMALTGDSSHAF